MEKGLEEGQFLLFADGEKIAESFSASAILDKHDELKRTGKHAVLTTLKVVLHYSSCRTTFKESEERLIENGFKEYHPRRNRTG